MVDAIKTILAVIGGYTVVGVVSSLVIYLKDRSGNSGRTKHWTEED